jgi:hypothetical protein
MGVPTGKLPRLPDGVKITNGSFASLICAALRRNLIYENNRQPAKNEKQKRVTFGSNAAFLVVLRDG